MLDFFEDYLEGKIIAVVPPSVRMPQNIARKNAVVTTVGTSRRGDGFRSTNPGTSEGGEAHVLLPKY